MLSKTFITNTFVWSALALALVVKAPEKPPKIPTQKRLILPVVVFGV